MLAYTDGVVLTAHGKSDLLPGISRTYSLVLPRADQSLYNMFIGAGTYTVTARPSDAAIPSERRQIKNAAAGTLLGQSFEFKSFDQTLVLTGTLYKTLPPSPTFQTGLALQAFESANGQPLSQVAIVQSNGAFELYVHPDAAALPSLTLIATPRDNTALVPTKSFVISPVPRTQETLAPLELGNFGDALPLISGRILSAAGAPVKGATVMLEGAVNGGGSFRSRTVITDMNGIFGVDLLPSATGHAYTLTAIPPPESAAGILQTQVRAGLDGQGKPALLSATKDEPRSDFTCPSRVLFTGTVLNPDGSAAVGVRVEATATAPLDMRPVPTSIATAVTGPSGLYTLMLDPAWYRFDYVAYDPKLPRKSRVVRVEQTEAEVQTDAGTRNDEYRLSVGRTVTGVVTVRPNSDGSAMNVPGTPAANALVRFYRVTTVEGVASSLLIGEGYSDQNGTYSIALPSSGPSTR
ncbi:MAG: carboxypeptidase regulatory-like domain-containing protein [Myxococcaceae bacterium]|nr:carboxypeptidase regulatory-like domain-containing protein [Myxococcaceae bacterium]